MGRAEKQTKRKSAQKKPVDISTDAKREKWLEKSNKRRNKVEWVTLTASLDLVAIDPELLLDQDGDRVYRQVYFVTKDGLPTEKSGYAKTYDSSDAFRKTFKRRLTSGLRREQKMCSTRINGPAWSLRGLKSSLWRSRCLAGSDLANKNSRNVASKIFKTRLRSFRGCLRQVFDLLIFCFTLRAQAFFFAWFINAIKHNHKNKVYNTCNGTKY